MPSSASSAELNTSANAKQTRFQPLLTLVAAAAAGLLFGIGLLVSGMSNPTKVLNFLDVLGHWDPSLAFVMGGAVATTLIGYPLIQRQSAPVLAARFQLPTRKDIDRPLVLGAALFGVGWGIGGFCPGPAWTSLSTLAPGALVFIICMLLGMWLTSNWIRRQAR